MSIDSTKSELNLVSLLKKDDLAAFDQLYWKYQKAVFQNAYKLTRDTLVSEDIVQEVFVSLWERRQSIDSDRPVGGWLFVSSYNRAVNVLKKKLRESIAVKESGVNRNASEPEADNFEIQFEILEKAINELSPQKRKVFELCKIKGKTYEEAGKEMNISRHTVKEYLSDALRLLKEYAAKHPKSGLLLIALPVIF
jgi:RNA polymerase sigma-70 factor (family 1)